MFWSSEKIYLEAVFDIIEEIENFDEIFQLYNNDNGPIQLLRNMNMQPKFFHFKKDVFCPLFGKPDDNHARFYCFKRKVRMGLLLYPILFETYNISL